MRRFIILLLLIAPLSLKAQVDEAIEQWSEEGGGESVADLSDLLLQLANDPVNLNDTVAITSLPFLSPFQVRALKTYIILYGQLLSVKELKMVPGFDSATVALILPLVKVEPYTSSGKLTWKQLFGNGRHTVVSGLGGTVERAQGYDNGHYEGDNLHALMCYTYSFESHINIRFSADKDPMEAWGKDNFVGYHLMIGDIGRLERLVVGRYNLQFGQGVALWTGFRPFSILGASPVRFGNGVKTASAFYESDYQEGLAATVDLGCGFSLSGFGSRTEDEWFGGSHLTWRHDNLLLGLTAVATLLDDSIQLHEYAYNQDYFRGDRQAVVGVDALWQAGQLLLYGEVAVDHQGASAGIGGFRITTGGDNSFGVSVRHYDTRYHNLHAGAYSVGDTRNEQGITLDTRLNLPWKFVALLSADLHRFPSLRYGSYAPSSGAWLRAQLGRSFGSHVEASVRFSLRQKQRNVPNIDSTLYIGEETAKQQLQGQVRVSLGPWRFTTRAMLSWFEAGVAAREWGWLLAQEVRYTDRSWQAALQAAWFDIDSYNARIYLNESNLQYAFSIPQLQGRGLRLSALVRYALGSHLNLSAKYTLSLYPDQDTIGTGDAATPGSLRQTWLLQLRWNIF